MEELSPNLVLDGAGVPAQPAEYKRLKALNRWRLQSGWILLALILAVAPSPTPPWAVAGTVLLVLGVAIRSLAAATLVKSTVVTTHGIYSVIRHPLYLGNLLAGAGFACFGGHWMWLAACLIFFVLIYRELILAEERFLGEKHPEEAARYVASVPVWWPNLLRLGNLRGTLDATQWVKNHELRNALALLGGWALFAIKTLVLPVGQYWWGG